MSTTSAVLWSSRRPGGGWGWPLTRLPPGDTSCLRHLRLMELPRGPGSQDAPCFSTPSTARSTLSGIGVAWTLKRLVGLSNRLSMRGSEGTPGPPVAWTPSGYSARALFFPSPDTDWQGTWRVCRLPRGLSPPCFSLGIAARLPYPISRLVRPSSIVVPPYLMALLAGRHSCSALTPCLVTRRSWTAMAHRCHF